MRRVRNDARVEILVVIGILATWAGVVVAMVLAHLRTAPWLLGSIAAALLAGGIGLMLRRRWAGMVLATMFLALPVAYAVDILIRCRDCSAVVLLANLACAVLFAAPGVVIVRWRRLLR